MAFVRQGCALGKRLSLGGGIWSVVGGQGMKWGSFCIVLLAGHLGTNKILVYIFTIKLSCKVTPILQGYIQYILKYAHFMSNPI